MDKRLTFADVFRKQYAELIEDKVMEAMNSPVPTTETMLLVTPLQGAVDGISKSSNQHARTSAIVLLSTTLLQMFEKQQPTKGGK